MSSDLYDVELSRQGLDLTLQCTTSGAGGANDYERTRSFVLHALAREAKGSPLHEALAALGFDERWNDPTFYEQYVGKFLAWTRLIRRENICDEDARSAYLGELHERSDVVDVLAALHQRFPPHRFLLQARLTEARFGDGLPASFGTTCFDVWNEDPAVDVPVPDSGIVSTEGPRGRSPGMVKAPKA